MSLVKCWYHYFLDRQACNNYAAYLLLAHIGSILTIPRFQAGCHPPRSIQYPEQLHIIQVDNAPAHKLDSSELPDNVILLFQPPACPEVNPTERVWEYLKDFLAKVGV